MFEDDDNDYILLVLGVLAAVLLIAVPGIIRQDNTGIPDLGAAEVSDDGAVEDDDLFAVSYTHLTLPTICSV